LYLVSAGGLLILLALPALQLHVTGGDNRGTPRGTQASDGLYILEASIGPGPLAPHQIVVVTEHPGDAGSTATVAAERRLIGELSRDRRAEPATIQAPAVSSAAIDRQADLLDASAQTLQIRAAARTDAGTAEAKALVQTIRDRYIPAARFPKTDTVLLTGAPA